MTNRADSANGLKKDALSYPEVLAQSVSVIAPSTVPAAVIGLIFATAGNGMWLSFLLGALGLVLVSLNINAFARRSASPGSLYTYIVQGLGPFAGVLSGWAMLLAYLLTGMSTLCGFAIFGQMLLAEISIQVNVAFLFVFGTLLAGYVAYRDIQLSAKMMLVFEGIAIVAVTLLGLLIWGHSGVAVDTDQIYLRGSNPGAILGAIVLVIFGFSGFESSTSLGDEAKNPLQSIPRSVIESTVYTGFFYIFMAYTIVLGFHGVDQNLGKTEAPLALLSDKMGLGVLGHVISVGALLSFFSCTLACINSAARLLFSMARHGIFHGSLGTAHEFNQTPHIAVIISALLTLIAPLILVKSGVTAFDAQGYFGSLCSFGFLLVYILVSIAAPVYLRAIGKLRKRDIAASVAAVLFMMLPLAGSLGIPGSTMFPVPEYPQNLIPLIFLGYMLAGVAWYQVQRTRTPHLAVSMTAAVEEAHRRFNTPPIEADKILAANDAELEAENFSIK